MTAKPDIERLLEKHKDCSPAGCDGRVLADEITAMRKRLEDAERERDESFARGARLAKWIDELHATLITAERERDEAYERAAKACENERVDAIATREECDRASPIGRSDQHLQRPIHRGAFQARE